MDSIPLIRYHWFCDERELQDGQDANCQNRNYPEDVKNDPARLTGFFYLVAGFRPDLA